MNYMYDPIQIKQAAEWLSVNNRYVDSSFRIEKSIYGNISSWIERGSFLMDNCGLSQVSTYGYTITFCWEYDNTIGIDVTVDPNVSRPCHAAIVDEEHLGEICLGYMDTGVDNDLIE